MELVLTVFLYVFSCFLPFILLKIEFSKIFLGFQIKKSKIKNNILALMGQRLSMIEKQLKNNWFQNWF
jgi:hypothetical protein